METRTAFQLARDYGGKTVAWDTGEFVEVDCRVIDARVFYGRELLLIEPVTGTGSKWVRANKCRVKNANETDQGTVNQRGSEAPAQPVSAPARRRPR